MAENNRRFHFETHQRISSYDPNMCTTAARFSPFYKKTDVPQQKDAAEYKNLIYAPTNVDYPDNSTKTVDPSYITFNPNDTQLAKRHEEPKLFTANPTSSTVQQTIDGIPSDPVTTNIVFHRSPNGHLYQNYYSASEDNMQEVEFVPVNVNGLTTIEGDAYTIAPYGFPHGCHMDTLDNDLNMESHQNLVEEEENQKRILEAQIVERMQQRILLESTMSPLLAAVNDITQRDAQFSYLKQDYAKEVTNHEESGSANPSAPNPSSIYNEDSSDDDYILVSDKPVQSRAVATLPSNYLYLGSVNLVTNEPSVYAKKAIRQRTKFGPFEGEIRFTSDISLNNLRAKVPRHYPLLLVEQSRILDVSNENTSNWMRFVRLAHTYAEQNIQIIKENDRIYFKCNRDIYPKEELRVGYHKTYAEKYNLPILEPSEADIKRKYELDNPWMCFECDQRFPTSKDMQQHLKVHDVEDAASVKPKKRVKRKPKNVKKLFDLPKNSSRCLVCCKVFMTNASLKKHFATHLTARKSATKSASLRSKGRQDPKKIPMDEKVRLDINQENEGHSNTADRPNQCSQCDKQCSTPTALAAHIRSHTIRVYSCVYCQQTFNYVMDFKKHVGSHCIDGMYPCLHCKKEYKEYHLARKHIRLFHPAVKYPCNECGRLFRQMRVLRLHKLTHSKTRVYKCAKCDETYAKPRELRRHVKTVHKGIPKPRTATGDNPILNAKKPISRSFTKTKTTSTTDYLQSQFKCDQCRVGFKRRGMLVNHIVKRHPGRSIDSIEDLNQPIIKVQSLFHCPHCSKVYKNNAKRKGHILKNHPGMSVPPSIRKNSALCDANMQTVGCVEADIQKCHLCYKQYISRTRLLKHFRKDHGNEKQLSMVLPPYPIMMEENCCAEQMMNIYKPPVSPENKLLKLSSAALELSSIEDRKFFDFLNERSDTTSAAVDNRSNYKIAESEFEETSSNTELNGLPELFDETIACIT